MSRYQLARSDCSFQTHLHSIHLKKVVDEKLHSCHDGPVCLPPCDLQEQSPLLPSLNCDTLTVVVIGLENVSIWSSLNIEVVTYFHCSLKPRPLEEGSGFETIYIDWQSKALYQAILNVNNTYSEVRCSLNKELCNWQFFYQLCAWPFEISTWTMQRYLHSSVHYAMRRSLCANANFHWVKCDRPNKIHAKIFKLWNIYNSPNKL